jgi:hypothetical protein
MSEKFRLSALTSPPLPHLHNPPPNKPQAIATKFRPLPPTPTSKPPLPRIPISSTLINIASDELNKSLNWKIANDGTLTMKEPLPAPPTPLPDSLTSDALRDSDGKDSKSNSSETHLSQHRTRLFEPNLATGRLDDSVVLLVEARLPCEIPGCPTLIPLGYANDHARFAIESHLSLLLRIEIRPQAKNRS